MARAFIGAILACIAAVGSASVSHGSSPLLVGSVRCIHGRPLVYAVVSVDGNRYTTSGFDGEFAIPWLTAGAYVIECSYPYHGLQSSKQVVIVRSGVTRIEFKLDPADRSKADGVDSCPCRFGILNAPDQTWEASYCCGCSGSGKVNLASAEVKPTPAPAPRFALEQNHPNPIKDTTSISFELAAGSTARLRIYDATGRLVRSLLDEKLAIGAHTITWDGRNERGHRVSAGVYIYQLETGTFSAEHQLVVLP